MAILKLVIIPGCSSLKGMFVKFRQFNHIASLYLESEIFSNSKRKYDEANYQIWCALPLKTI